MIFRQNRQVLPHFPATAETFTAYAGSISRMTNLAPSLQVIRSHSTSLLPARSIVFIVPTQLLEPGGGKNSKKRVRADLVHICTFVASGAM